MTYRSRREERPATAPKAGLVADMVRQFADPYAFLRELVQNGIDAGASALDVTVALEPGDLASISVADDGCGMTPEVVEGELLTLFSSSKEGDPTKIGKYGVGFVSVLALEPDEVAVDTWRGGKAWRVRLGRDHHYSIEEAPARPGSGTVVTVLSPVPPDGFGPHVARARTALHRWCRHAERPIRLVTVDRELGGGRTEERIDAPVTVFAAASITATIEGETFVVGPSAGTSYLDRPGADELERADDFAGFYNRGLTLFETANETFAGLSGVRFKVVSPHLSHTLSRDNVRRDEAFEQVLDRVRELVKGPLRSALATELKEAARAAAAGERTADYMALLEAALHPPVALAAREISFPLTDPLHGSPAVTDLRSHTPGHDAPVLAWGADALTAAITAEGRPVVHCVHPAMASLVRRCFPKQIVLEARRAFLRTREIVSRAGSADEALCAEVARALAAVGEAVARVSLGALDGAGEQRTGVVVPAGVQGAPHLAPAREIELAWRRFSTGHRLLLNVASPAVTAARTLAERDPGTAGHLLARALLVEERWPLDARANARLLELAGEGR